MPDNMARRSDPSEAASPLLVGDVMVALGDSIAAGIGAAHVSEGCMWLLAGRLRRRWPALRFEHLAVPSESSTTMLAPGGQLDLAERVIGQAADAGRRVGPVGLCIGGNDIMEASRLGDEVALQRLDENLGTILRRLDAVLRRGGRRLAEVGVVQTVYNPFEGLPSDSADLMAPLRASRSGFNATIRRVAQNHGVRICDVASLFRGRNQELTWALSGDIHPTGTGHEMIADEYMRVGGWSAVP